MHTIISAQRPQVFADFERARGMGRAGRARCESEFTWDRIAEQTEAFYHDAL